MDQDDRTAAAMVFVVDPDRGAVFGADDDRSHCLSPFLQFPLGADANMRIYRPSCRTCATAGAANSVTPKISPDPGLAS